MISNTFEYAMPGSVAEAAALLERPGAVALAGGSDVVIALKQGRMKPSLVVDLQQLRELRGISQQSDELRIGALTTCAEITRNPEIRQHLQALAEAADEMADAQVRNTATVGGNLARGRAADLAAAALALDAIIMVRNRQDVREVSAQSFYAQADHNGLSAGNMIEAVVFPLLTGKSGSAYVKFKNPASDYALSGVAAALTLAANKTVTFCRVAVVGATARPERLTGIEHALIGQLADEALIASVVEKASHGLTCLNDLAASADYRAHLTTIMVERALNLAVQRAH